MGNEDSVMLPLVYGKAAEEARKRLEHLETWYHEL